MSDPISQAGGTSEPSSYAALGMDRRVTGLWTQRSPIRDADVPYLVGKYYGGSRYDSILDGINREVSAKLTSVRRPGHTPYNTGGIPPVFSYYSYKYIQDGTEVLRVLADTHDAIYDITAGSLPEPLFTKDFKGKKARFCGVNTELFWTDGDTNKKWINGGKAWGAAKTFTVGDLIIDPNGNVQVFESQAVTLEIDSVEVRIATMAGAPDTSFVVFTLIDNVPIIPALYNVYPTGLTTKTDLNGTAMVQQNIEAGWNLDLAPNQVAFRYPIAAYPNTPDTGILTTAIQFDSTGNPLTGVTGATAPAWNPATGRTTQDGAIGTGVTWTNFASPEQDWGIPTPTVAPTVAPGPAMRYWYPRLNLTGVALGSYSILDANGAVQVMVGLPGSGVTGNVPPIWNTSLAGYTFDGGVQWVNAGDPATWLASVSYPYGQSILDKNANLEYIITLAPPGDSGTLQPAWPTTPGGTIGDNNLTWQNCGTGSQLVTGGYKYGYCYHSIDGSVSTMSVTVSELYGALGASGGFMNILRVFGTDNPQIDQIWLFRTAQGQSTLVFLDAIPNFGAEAITYYDTIADTSTYGNQALIPQIPAPIAHQNDPPPAGMTAPVYHLGRVWYILDNLVGFSGGPDTITGNGNTAFPPLNTFSFPEQPTKIRPVTVQGGGTIVYTTSHTYIIPGAGSSDSPFGQPQIYMGNVGLMSYDAEEFVGSTAYLFTTKRKLVAFDPSAGYVEWGFPIGDQFKKVTTAGFNATLFNPSSTYVTWHEADSGDTGLYVADGAVGWFRFSPVASPETGYLWSTFAAIQGGTSAVQSVETSPGINDLLVGPTKPDGTGLVLRRDETVNQDNGVVYPSWETIGAISLALTGQVCEVAHIAIKSVAVGARPRVSLLFDELYATPEVPFDEIFITASDPPDLEPSVTMYSDRYATEQNGVCPLCHVVQILIDYWQQDFPDETLSHAIYGATHQERKQQ